MGDPFMILAVAAGKSILTVATKVAVARMAPVESAQLVDAVSKVVISVRDETTPRAWHKRKANRDQHHLRNLLKLHDPTLSAQDALLGSTKDERSSEEVAAEWDDVVATWFVLLLDSIQKAGTDSVMRASRLGLRIPNSENGHLLNDELALVPAYGAAGR